MSLQPLQLDDLTWTDMVEAIRGRIAANTDGEWTMHGPLDPGVTLLELFAYLFEQRLYWLDQVPEPLLRAILALLDDRPLTTTAANTVLAFHSLADNAPQHINTGDVFYPRDTDLPLPLTTLEPVTVLPLARQAAGIDLMTLDKERSADLWAGRLVPLLPADGSAAQLQLLLWLNRPLVASEVGGSFTLFFELDTAAAITPEWADQVPDLTQWFNRTAPSGYRRFDNASTWLNDFIASDWHQRRRLVEAPATLQWHYSTGSLGKKAFAANQLQDATGSLRRSGVVRITIPVDWQPLITSAAGPVAYALWVTCEACHYSAPPRLRRLIPNVAVARQWVEVQVDWADLKPQLNDWLRLPGQMLQLPLTQLEPLEHSVRLQFREADGQMHVWHPTDHLYHHGPEDRVFVVDRQRKRLLFGDGLTGRIPVLDNVTEPLAQLRYQAGGGSQGNVGELTWVSSTTPLQAFNPVAGIGGKETETLAAAKARVGADLSRRERAVTAQDYEDLAQTTPGVAIARAHAAVGHHPGFPCHPVAGAITVFVVPQVPRENTLFATGAAVLAPKVDPGALVEVARRMDTRRLLTAEVYVRPVRYRAVNLAITLQGVYADESDESSLQIDLALIVSRYLDALIGGDLAQGWPFGEPLRPSSFSQHIRLHVDAGITVKRVAIALDASNEFEDCKDVAIGEHNLVYLQELSLSLDRRPVAQGGLR